MIYIIGAGPVGLYSAFLLAKQNLDVAVFEEHEEIGSPIQCTGLITKSIKKFFRLDKSFIDNEISRVEINSKNHSTTFNLRNNEFLVNRKKFDRHIEGLAKKKGAKIFTNHKFLRLEKGWLVFETGKGIKKINFSKKDILIGADGPTSNVSKIINKKRSKTVIGSQAKINFKTVKNTYKIFLGKDKGRFSWIVPESEGVARVGTMSNDPKVFQNLMSNFKKYIICYQSGLIPIYSNNKLSNIQDLEKKVFLVGDAASTVKNTTGGGIVYGLTSAEVLAKSLIKNLNYQKELKKTMKKELWIHDLINKILKTFSDKDFDLLVKICKEQKIKNIIESFNREKPSKVLIILAISDIRFFLFLKNLLKLFFNK